MMVIQTTSAMYLLSSLLSLSRFFSPSFCLAGTIDVHRFLDTKVAKHYQVIIYLVYAHLIALVYISPFRIDDASVKQALLDWTCNV